MMIWQRRLSSILLLWCLVLFDHAASGQSLSIIRAGERACSIEVDAPLDTRYVLQASDDWQVWVDLNDNVSGRVSHPLDMAEAAQRFFRLTPWTPPLTPITVVILGDSTVADFASNFDSFNGWGQGIYGYFKPAVRVVNLAIPGHSTDRFLSSVEKIKLLLIRPEFVLIEFGLIDEFGSEDDQNTTLEEFAENLRTIIREVRAFNGTPILITPQAQRRFNDATGLVIPLFQERYAVIRQVAAELETHLIDLNRLSIDLLNQLGQFGSDYLWWGTDYLHFSDEGARVIAGLVVDALPPTLKPYLVENVHQAPTP